MDACMGSSFLNNDFVWEPCEKVYYGGYEDLSGWLRWELGEFTPSYILHTRAFGTYLLGGLFTL